MPNPTEHYQEVIADLERRRDQLSEMIANLRSLAGEGGATGGAEKPREDGSAPARDQRLKSDNPFLGMKIIDAAKIVLAENRKPMAPADITQGLEDGGLMTKGSNVVASILSRRQRDVGDVVSPQRGLWGLKEWYPGRSFGKKQSETKSEEVTEPSTNEPEQPASPTLIFPQRSSD